jgi:hypothetical protein
VLSWGAPTYVMVYSDKVVSRARHALRKTPVVKVMPFTPRMILSRRYSEGRNLGS